MRLFPCKTPKKSQSESAKISRPQIMFEIARQSFSFQHKTLGEIVKKIIHEVIKKRNSILSLPASSYAANILRRKGLQMDPVFAIFSLQSWFSFLEICSSHQPMLTGCDMSSQGQILFRQTKGQILFQRSMETYENNIQFLLYHCFIPYSSSNGKMHKRVRPAQRASLAIVTLVASITTTKGQGFYVELF